jgi:2-iminobutanoate/2-iminopropanoate deaminase
MNESKHVINTISEVPPPRGPYSRAVRFENTIYVSGLSPRNADGSPFRGTIEEEVANVLDNIKRILESAGSGMEKVLKMTIILEDPGDWVNMNSVYQRYFAKDPPARTTFQSKLGAAKVEMDAIAFV